MKNKNDIILEVGKFYKTDCSYVANKEPKADIDENFDKLNQYPFLILQKLNNGCGNWFWYKVLINGKIRYSFLRENQRYISLLET